MLFTSFPFRGSVRFNQGETPPNTLRLQNNTYDDDDNDQEVEEENSDNNITLTIISTTRPRKLFARMFLLRRTEPRLRPRAVVAKEAATHTTQRGEGGRLRM